MSNDNGTTQFTESPASWNTRYITPDGFTCQLTLRAETGKELLERATSALTYLREQGMIPFYGYSKGNELQNSESNLEKSSNHQANDNPARCPIHEVEMKKWSKNGKVWYSHKTEEGWCSGKPANGKKE
jgi:hypothetical protein